MKLDYKQDWIEIIRKELIDRGFDVESVSDFDTISIQYFNIRSRLIPQRKREVRVSDTFSCPSRLESSFAEIKRKIREGEDLTPHLSTGIKNLDYNDPMLNDWGIYHFHLGQTLQANGFVERTGPLLYARVDLECVYCIDVYEHQNWTKQEMIRVVHRNWPGTIEPYLLKDVIGLVDNLSDERLKQARKHNVNTGIEIAPGVVYAPIGGGYMTDGTGQRVRRSAMQMTKILKQLEEDTRAKLDWFRETASSKGITLSDEPHFRLEVRDSKLLVVEQFSQISLEIGDWEKL